VIIDILQPAGPVVFPTGRHPEKENECVGWAVCETILHPKIKQLEVKVWDIHIRPQYRRKGYASELIKGVVDSFKHFLNEDESVIAWTNYEKISDYGAKAFLNAGFESKRSLKKGEADKLVWKSKEKKDSD
jgi:ribosomal protein S18 acetylase RimI-like enzyme